MSSKLSKIIMETYTELYANCTTPVDFDLLVESSPRDENGKRMIPYEDYFIDENLFEEIVRRKIKQYHIKKHDQGSFRFAIYMGCSPTTIQEEKELKNERHNVT